jgi:hypothetical protein
MGLTSLAKPVKEYILVHFLRFSFVIHMYDHDKNQHTLFE